MFTKEVYHERKRLLIAELGGMCHQCLSSESLEFHHVNPSTKDACVTELLANMAKARAESKKCILLCTNCHTMEDRRKPIPPHGTVRRYNFREDKCRCDKCREAWRLYIKKYRSGR